MKITFVLLAALFLLPCASFATDLPAYPKTGMVLENLGTRLDVTFDKFTVDASQCVSETLMPVSAKVEIKIGTEVYRVTYWSCMASQAKDGYVGYAIYATNEVFAENISLQVLPNSVSVVAAGNAHNVLVTARY